MANQGNDHPDFQSNNPWARTGGSVAPSSYTSEPPQQLQENPWASSGAPGTSSYNGSAPPQQQQQSYAPTQQQQGDYAPPPGPPPQLPKRSESFRESDFVPAGERGEQREAMEQFEMSKSGAESQQDRDVEQLQREFPSVDGSLIAAIHGDSGSMGATREMLQELASQT